MILSLFCLFLPTQALAGGGEPYSPFYIDNGFNILPNSLTSRRTYKRRTHLSATYASEEYDEFTIRRNFNIKAWSDFLKRSPEEVEKIVYQGEFLADLDPETQAYLTLAREQEPLVLQPKKEAQPYNQTIESLQAELQITKSDFLRQRYVYLVLRLAHYSRQYDKVEKLYAQYQQERQQPESEISHWIDALYAGALQRNGNRAEAAYRFAQIYLDSQTRRLEAQTNFIIKTDLEWHALLDKCRDDDEKAMMYFIRGLKTKANSLQELKTIYQLAPNSPWVDEALVRELEYVQFSKGFKTAPRGHWWQAVTTVEPDHLIADSRELHSKPQLVEQAKKRRIAYLAELNDVVQMIRAEKKRDDRFVSDFAALYLKLLQQQAITVDEVRAFQARYDDQSRTTATKALEYFVYLENLQAIDAEAETVISDYLKQLVPLYRTGDEYGPDRGDFDQNILDYTYIKLEPLYLQQKADWQPAKTYSAKYRGEVILDNMLVVELRDFNRLLKEDGSQHNLLLQKMLKEMRLVAGEYPLDEAIARKYLAADMPEKALAALENKPQASNKVWRTAYNPFTTTLSGNNRKRGTATKTLKEVAETMLTLKKQIADNPKDAQANYLLGTLYYNMSWFGNSPMLLRYYRQTIAWDEGEIDLNKAKSHYQVALRHSDDRNLTAKVLYALAKIEQVELYTLAADKKAKNYGWVVKPGRGAGEYKSYVEQQKKRGLGKYLNKLKNYEDTDYFQQIISQCADYQYFHSE